jgi:hypothetical protein
MLDGIQASVGKISFTMDLWSDENLRPFMGITAHWIEPMKIQTSTGINYALKLCSDLVGFYNAPGSHTGEHLAVAFLHVLDCIEITHKVCFDIYLVL